MDINNYTIEDIKAMGLRCAKLVNHKLARSKMNKNLKPFFTESSVLFFERNGKIGVALNKLEIDNTSALEELGAERYTNNLALITETVNQCLKQTGLNKIFTLDGSSKHSEMIKYGNKYHPKYMQCSLVLSEEAQAILPAVRNANSLNQMQDDLSKINSNITGYTGTKTIWKSPTDELRDELDTDSTISANRYDKKTININNNTNSYPELYNTNLELGVDLDDFYLDLQSENDDFNVPDDYEHPHDVFDDSKKLISD